MMFFLVGNIPRDLGNIRLAYFGSDRGRALVLKTMWAMGLLAV